MTDERDFQPTPDPEETLEPDALAILVSESSPAGEDIPEEALSIYLREVGRVPLLDPDEERRLAETIVAGRQAAAALETAAPEERAELERLVAAGEAARQQMAEANLRLVVSVARRYQHRGLPLADLIQEGNVGLLRAIDKFEPERGYKFSTYAYWWIRQAITRALGNDARSIRLPIHVQEQLSAIYAANHRVEQALGRSARLSELAEAVGLSEERVEELLQAANHTLSLNAPTDEEAETELGDLVPDPNAGNGEDVVEAWLRREAIEEALSTLTERQRIVLTLRYGLDSGTERTLAEVASMLSVSRERVRQIEATALQELHRSARAARLAAHLT
ncbi:MAG TPA: sigma-70 family RNA polymerase sigma factor [Chloroflexota bacterium]|uniref:RNA polymerase sigma factor n=1 Tax=Thermorudis sp. TaxID=1969470 RepID=A0A7C3ARI2_9BACT